MKKILILAMALMIVGCKFEDGLLYSTHCIEGVNYITINGAITPMLKPDGTISTCLDEQSLIEYMEDMEYHNE